MNSGAQKVGHIAGVIAYGLVSTMTAAAAGVVENTLKGLVQTGKNLASEMRSAQEKAPEAR